MLHYYPRHVSSINMPIFKRKNCIHTASGIVALCKRLYSTPVIFMVLYSTPDDGSTQSKHVADSYLQIILCLCRDFALFLIFINKYIIVTV